MNNLERKMLAILKDLKENYGAVSVKAEFEAEGSRLAELSRLNEIVCRADMELTIKIGGCEAMSDLYEAEVIGSAGVMGPMIETPFAMSKFLSAVNAAYTEDKLNNTKLVINAETITCHEFFDQILNVPGAEKLDTVVVGRVDLSASMGLSRDSINGEEVFEVTKSLLAKIKAKGIHAAIGGGISMDAIPFIERLGNLVDKFETRKITFSAPIALKNVKMALLRAMEFETLYLKNKQNFYQRIASEDTKRIEMMEARIQAAKREV